MKKQFLSNDEKWVQAQIIDNSILTVFPKYLVSDQGRVMSTKGTPKILKAHIHRSSCSPSVALCVGCHARHIPVSRLILSSFCADQYTEDAIASHINNDLTDDRLCNLQWKQRSCKSISAGVQPASLL